MRSPVPLLRNTVSAFGPSPGDALTGHQTAPRAGRRRARASLLGALAVVVVLATVAQPVVTVTILVGLASAWHAFVARSLREHPGPAAGGTGAEVEDST